MPPLVRLLRGFCAFPRFHFSFQPIAARFQCIVEECAERASIDFAR
jgi:hypothetical protein